jgi:hypothetical protein
MFAKNTSITATRPAPSFSAIGCSSYRTACGATIELSEKARRHLDAHPDVLDILHEAIGKIQLRNRPHQEIEVDLGRAVGISTCIKTTAIRADEQAQFALRKGRQFPSRVITGVTGSPTSKAVVIVRQLGRYQFDLVTAWIGSLAKKEPWDRNIKSPAQFQECLDFWCNHALLHDPDTMGHVFQGTWEQIVKSGRFDFSSSINFAPSNKSISVVKE